MCILKNPYVYITTAIKNSQDVFIKLKQACQNSVKQEKMFIIVVQSFSAKYFIHQKSRFRWTDSVYGFKFNS